MTLQLCDCWATNVLSGDNDDDDDDYDVNDDDDDDDGKYNVCCQLKHKHKISKSAKLGKFGQPSSCQRRDYYVATTNLV